LFAIVFNIVAATRFVSFSSLCMHHFLAFHCSSEI
jgi:GTP cyclohydrolase I